MIRSTLGRSGCVRDTGRGDPRPSQHNGLRRHGTTRQQSSRHCICRRYSAGGSFRGAVLDTGRPCRVCHCAGPRGKNVELLLLVTRRFCSNRTCTRRFPLAVCRVVCVATLARPFRRSAIEPLSHARLGRGAPLGVLLGNIPRLFGRHCLK